ncbi:MAG: glutamine-hydrolyzing carbamoyl-phosphate synthase small subunit [Pontiella sp.]|nr:glutamine-hydrolyzing carbamoyl-phosphate synthase small subunit [Pontiella sp.]NNJ70090.1 glutamine-hydrolyzing carbamoyl-phosphate synthase small subunit [Kiritimatiellales bacterium]
MKKAIIALEDGTCFEGRAFAGSGEFYGELVFNTSMTGYQEILTDPSYHGQIVTMTYPLIGNYGVNEEDVESRGIFAEGLVVSECSRMHSNWRATKSLPDYLAENGKIGIDDVDTRAITLHIRDKGAMKCVVSTEDLDKESLVKKAKASDGLVGRNLATEVTTDATYVWPKDGKPDATYKVAVIDCGIKLNQLRILDELGCECTVYPNTSAAEEILATRPDGIFVSNGPGDPAGAPEVTELVGKLIESKRPMFGICFGHQMLGLALGAETFKLKFGHRGGNQPIQDLRTTKVEIASHNHGFCIDADSVDPAVAEITHLNLNDKTVAGLKHKQQPLFCVQYHPEAAPGPHDPFYLFEEFIDLMKETK